MEKNEIFETFSILSKVIIIIPIVVVVVGLVYKFNKTQNANPKTQSQNLNLKSDQSSNKKVSKINLDLNGPWVCVGKIDNSEINLFIKDKKIKATVYSQVKKENMLLVGDCFYRWQEGQYNGEKICGLSPMVTTAQTIIGFTGIDVSLFTSQLTKLGIDQSIATNEAKINELIKSCKKDNVDSKKLKIPSNILFKNTLTR